MDRERFGRALGGGLRDAVRAAVKAADAATSPAPVRGAGRPVAAPVTQTSRPAARQVASRPAPRPVAKRGAAGIGEGGRRFAQASWKPVARAGGVLWYEVTGVLFGLIAAAAALGVWAGRANLRGGPGRTHEWVGVGMLTVFGYFAASSFVRASRRGRRE